MSVASADYIIIIVLVLVWSLNLEGLWVRSSLSDLDQ